jgi:predicted aconitase with swiveling domain
MEQVIHGRPIVPGEAQGVALVTTTPLSFWGGYDHRSGEITDRRHPLSGAVAAGKILVLPFTRGSSTTTAVLLEAIKAGTAPAAIVTSNVDSFLALASIVADEMYRSPIPIIAISETEALRLKSGDQVAITVDGLLRIAK